MLKDNFRDSSRVRPPGRNVKRAPLESVRSARLSCKREEQAYGKDQDAAANYLEAIPKPLQQLHRKALFFLDGEFHDRYWAYGIVKALQRAYGTAEPISTKPSVSKR
jgi:hypothetical protein